MKNINFLSGKWCLRLQPPKQPVKGQKDNIFFLTFSEACWPGQVLYLPQLGSCSHLSCLLLLSTGFLLARWPWLPCRSLFRWPASWFAPLHSAAHSSPARSCAQSQSPCLSSGQSIATQCAKVPCSCLFPQALLFSDGCYYLALL